jgi:ATP/maltotriose-dependent transcriptional regulator MalT
MLELGHSLEEVRPRVEIVREWTSPFDVLATAQLAALDAVIAAHDGDVERARNLAATAVHVVDESDQLWQQADIRCWVSAVPRLRGDTHQEHRLLEEALDRYRRKGMIVLARRAEQRIASLD